jgi:hypothetical protein
MHSLTHPISLILAVCFATGLAVCLLSLASLLDDLRRERKPILWETTRAVKWAGHSAWELQFTRGRFTLALALNFHYWVIGLALRGGEDSRLAFYLGPLGLTLMLDRR